MKKKKKKKSRFKKRDKFIEAAFKRELKLYTKKVESKKRYNRKKHKQKLKTLDF